MNSSNIDKEHALSHLLDLLRIEGLGGKETDVANAIKKKLLTVGCKPDWITTDEAHKRIGEGHETGNLIVKLPGTLKAPRILFSAHMDTVPLCRGAEPIIKQDRIESKGNTGLGADDRTGCAALIVLAETLLQKKLPHPPLTLLFVIAEEGGLHGSRHVNFSDLGNPIFGFNIDGQEPNEVVIGAMSAMRWTATIKGRASHAGLEPHKGISAGLIASIAIASIAEQGYFGRIIKKHGRGTSNLGTINGGEADNQVMDKIILTGECRSHDNNFLNEIIKVHETCFKAAAKKITNEAGHCGQVDLSVEHDYKAFRLNENEPCVKTLHKAIATAGLTPNPLVMDAGLDANNFNEKGIPVVTLGAGAHNFHTVSEYVNIEEYQTACQVLLNIIMITNK